MTNFIQISGKVGDTIVVIGGADPASFQDNVMGILGPDAGEIIGSLFEQALVQKTAVHNIQQGVGVVSDAPQQAAPAQQGNRLPEETGVHEENDKWNNRYVYNVPGAPSCAHGVRVQKHGKSQAGKNYTGWVCPTQTPYAFRNKVTKAECSMEFDRR